MPTTPAHAVPARRVSPLDRKLRLRTDHWSAGAARVAARQGLQAPSFDLAADGFTEAIGGGISADSVRRITEGWGTQCEERRTTAAARANAPVQAGECPTDRRLPLVDPIGEQANLSTDGVMVLIRQAGWKEVKLSAISAVHRDPERPGAPRHGQAAAATRHGHLTRHSYQAGLWDADTMALHQYAEGVRRGIDQCARLSSVNDGAVWIERITRANFPTAVQIVDWSHASGRLWQVANAVVGASSKAARTWAATHVDWLWQGKVAQVAQALAQLQLEQAHYPPEVQQAAGYFQANAARMRYAEYRAQGYPIGSGTVESGARSVVQQRLKRPGRGWGRTTGQAMLAGLSVFHSGQFERLWREPHATAA